MRIAFLGDGSLNHVIRWVGYLHDRGHDVLLISFEDFKECPFPYRRLRKRMPTKMFGYMSALGSIRKILKSFRPELLNSLYVSGYGLVGALSGFRPFVVSALGSDLLVDYRSSLIHRIQINHSIRKADLVTTDAEILSDIAVSIGAPRERILKVYFGIDGNQFHPPDEAQSTTEQGTETARIVSTRKLYPIYNIDILIDAAPFVLEKVDARFIISGEGPERKHLEDKVSGLGLTDRFTFLGRVETTEIVSALQSATAYVSTSRSDSTSVSLLEAMACGAPPVVTDLPANREWVENGVNGLLFRDNDPAALADAVIKMIEDRELSRGAREENLRLIRERGLWHSNMERLEEAFRKLAREKAPDNTL